METVTVRQGSYTQYKGGTIREYKKPILTSLKVRDGFNLVGGIGLESHPTRSLGILIFEEDYGT